LLNTIKLPRNLRALMKVLPKANYTKQRCETPRTKKHKELAPIKENSRKRALSRNRRNSLNK